MKPKKESKPVFVDLRIDLHSRVKALAAIKGMSIPAAYTEALNRWLAFVEGGEARESPLGRVTDQEFHVLNAVLEMLRDKDISPDDPSTLKSSLLEMGRRRKRHERRFE